jgi:effector-binding domain-containing protein
MSTTTTTIRPELRTVEEQLVAIIPVTTKIEGIPTAIGDAYGELEKALQQAGQEITGPPFVRYLSFGPECSFEAGFPIATSFPASGRVTISTLPAGEVATAIHVGPYDELKTTYEALMGWVEEQGRKPGGQMWEVYLTDPGTEPDTSKWRTEVFVPLA